MPLYPNGSSSQKILTFTGMGTYVKENYNLCRERVTVFTQLCSDPSMTLKPEFVFKGKGKKQRSTIKIWSTVNTFDISLCKGIHNVVNNFLNKLRGLLLKFSFYKKPTFIKISCIKISLSRNGRCIFRQFRTLQL